MKPILHRHAATGSASYAAAMIAGSTVGFIVAVSGFQTSTESSF